LRGGEVEAVCPTCGARFTVPETVATTECPYCGTVFHVARGERVGVEHFYFPPSDRDPFDMTLRFVERQYGVPLDVRRASTLLRGTLHVVPVYFYHLHGRAKALLKSKKLGAFEAVAEEVDDVGVVAVRGPLRELLKGYPFPIRGKRFFDERVRHMGVYYEPEISQDEAKREAEATLRERLREEAEEMADSVEGLREELLRVEFKGLVHYPVWEIEYEYRGEAYRAFVDGVTGAVIRAEHPLSVKGRAMVALMGLTLLAVGVMGALVILAVGFKEVAKLAGAFASLAAGAVSSAPLFRRGVIHKVVSSEISVIMEK